MSVPGLTVVDSEAVLFCGTISMPRVGTLAVTVSVPVTLGLTLACNVAAPPPARIGMLQVTVVLVAGVGEQAVMVPVPPVKVMPAGMARFSVFAGASTMSSLVTVME